MKYSLSLHLPLSVIAATALLAWSNPASAQTYDWSCSEENIQKFEMQTPNVLVMLDRSGSMSWNLAGTKTSGVKVENRRWTIAKNAIVRVTNDALIDSTPPLANFGLGDFRNESASVALDCGASASAIKTQLDSWSPDGSTPTGAGIKVASQHACLKPTDGAPAATILVNDGEPTKPTNSSTAKQYAINEACGHRPLGPLYVVGFGAGAGVDYNNVLAAAGGTGTCNHGQDPCAIKPTKDKPHPYKDFEGKCSGAIQADDGDALMKALTDITATLACTFSIDFLGTPEAVTSVPDDAENKYEYFAVGVYTDGVNKLDICHENHPHIATADSLCFTNPNDPECKCDNAYPGQGWRFTSSDHRFVEMSEQYCENINNYDYESGSTWLACICDPESPNLGQECDVDNWLDNNVCPTGIIECQYGKEVCEPVTDCCTPGEACVVTDDDGEPLHAACALGERVCDDTHPLGWCQQVNFPEPEVCDGLDNDCDGTVDEDSDGNDCTTANPGRCGVGIDECVDGVLHCRVLGAMPEVCNGIDDDCDGIVDNMGESWSSSAYEEIRAGLTMEQQAATCNFSDVCVCPDGPANVSLAGTWDDFIAEYYPHCVCGSALEPSSTAGAPAPLGDSTDDSAPAAACSTAGGAQGGLAVLFGFALVALRRRF